jgi:hypothetical protein
LRLAEVKMRNAQTLRTRNVSSEMQLLESVAQRVGRMSDGPAMLAPGLASSCNHCDAPGANRTCWDDGNDVNDPLRSCPVQDSASHIHH